MTMEPRTRSLLMMGAAIPVPVSDTVCGLPLALSVTEMAPVREPVAVGAKITEPFLGYLLDGQQRLTSLSKALEDKLGDNLATRAFFDVRKNAFDGQLGGVNRDRIVGRLERRNGTVAITHVTLAAVILPLVLRTAYLAFTSRFDKHRSIARWTFPLWMYVSVTGVIVYLMLYQM